MRASGARAPVLAFALALGALAACGQAVAAPPVACVRNSGGVDLDVVAGVQGDRPDRPGLYLGTARARGGACWYADIDGAMNVSIRRRTPAPPAEQYTDVPTAGGGWTACPTQTSTNGWYVYTVRRARSGLACRTGGDAKGLEGPGDYE